MQACMPLQISKSLVSPLVSPLVRYLVTISVQACGELFLDIAEAMGLGSQALNCAEDAVQGVLSAIRQLARDVGIPPNLKELVSPSSAFLPFYDDDAVHIHGVKLSSMLLQCR